MDDRKKVVAICEPPTVNSGFGVVSKQVLPAIAEHYDLTFFATGAYGQDCMNGLKELGIDKVCVVPETFRGRELGVEIVDSLLASVDPHAVFSYYDIGSVTEYVKQTHVPFYPHVSYLIAEGEPMMRTWCKLFNDRDFKAHRSRKNYTIEKIILPSEYAAKVAYNQTGRQCPVGWHGYDHANFTQFPKSFKKDLRRAMSDMLGTDLSNTFMLLYVARNAGRKQWPRLFEAFRKLKLRLREENNHQRIVLFCQTKVFNEFKHGGWMLSELAEDIGLDGKDVFFGSVEDIGGVKFDASSEWSMVKLYNSADLYVHPSSVEGAGLPLLEAARCGLPVLTTEYGGGWDYAKDYAMPIKVATYDYHNTGVKQALVDIDDLAEKLHAFVTNPSLVHEYSAKSLKYCVHRWQQLRDVVLASLADATDMKYNYDVAA